ncbi:hypothetical protein PybrP1_002681 [[Pythium] brassicae (nom. inval.)]|nr:hypothetical protein PybrP1_002681 [[Pythium] brassicae (nom. inval.)]
MRSKSLTETPPAARLAQSLMADALESPVPPQQEGAPSTGGGSGSDSGRSDDGGPAEPEFAYERSFAFMTGRRLQRRYRGVYKKYSFMAQLLTWMMVLYVLLVLATLSLGPGESRASLLESDTPGSTTSDDLFKTAIVIFVIYVIVRVALIIRWLIYWVVLAEMLTYTLTGNVHALFWLDDTISDSDAHIRFVVMMILVVLEALTIAVYGFTHLVYPWVVRTNQLNSISWWQARPGPQTNTLSYRSIARFYTAKRNVIRYCGGLNADGQPHGYGMWTDTSYHGERLTGQWEDGVPIGPFRSFEHGSGYSFVNLRIGFCHNRSERKADAIAFWPKHSRDGLHWGVASVECSVSGGFFKFLPAVTHLTPSDAPDAPQSAADCLPILRTPADDVVFSSKASQHAEQPGARLLTTNRSSKRKIFREDSTPILERPLAVARKEALVLLHGYNCSLDYGMNRLAQLLALGDFPSFIHPFVFSWPSGGALAYFQAKKVGSESDRTASDFRSFLESLRDAGYTTLNIIAHSMGARVFFKCLNSGHLDNILMPVNSSAHLGQPRIQLSTLTFCNPDYSRDDFVKYGGGYDTARRYCDHITLYADSMDGALFYLEFLSKTSVCGPLNYSLGRRGTMVHRDVSESEPRERSETQFLNWTESNLRPAVDMDLAIASVNQKGKFAGVASFAYNRAPVGRRAQDRAHGVRDLLKNDPALVAEQQYLDMDVIDTTWMDNNVHAIRHNYFNINPTIVDDLRHLIVGKKRARARPGLLQTTSAENVYIFLVAPSHVTNK